MAMFGQCDMVSLSLEDVDLCPGETLQLNPVLTNALAPISYNWEGPNNFGSTDADIVIDDVQHLHSGIYSVTIVDANDCMLIGSADVQVGTLVVIQPIEVVCQTDEPVLLQASPAGGIFTGSGVTNDVFFDPIIAGPGEHIINYSYIDGDGCLNITEETIKVHDAENLSCKGDLNVSLDQNCSLGNLSVELFLDAHLDPDFYTFVLKDQYDQVIDIEDIGSYAGTCVIYEVVDVCTQNRCWGNMCIEDKIAPESLSCECEIPYIDDGNGNLIENPDCVFYCYDLWDLEILETESGNNNILPSVSNAVPIDNCTVFGDPIIQLQVYPEGDDCSTKTVIRTITYNFIDSGGELQSIDCTQTFLFKPVDLFSSGETDNGAWDGSPDIFHAFNHDGLYAYYTPEKEVIMPCGSDLSPESIAAEYDIDTPGRPEGLEKDDYNQTPNIVEHNEGVPYAYPYVVVQGWNGYHPKPVVNNLCNFYAVYSDQASYACGESCNGGKIIARSWNLLDWCSGETLVFVQNISSKDKEGPTVGNPDITVSVDPWECTANVTIPAPEHLYDACDQYPTWKIIPPAGYSVIDNTIIGIDKGSYQAWYEASDCCGNVTIYPIVINVIDKAPPIAITNQNIVVNLTAVLGSDGIAKIYAEDIDNFSYDPCGPVKLEVRRADGNVWCHQGNATFNDDGHEGDDPEDDDDGAFVIFCCEDILLNQDEDGTYFGEYDVILRVWDDGDMNGIFGTFGDNYNEAWTTIRVEDKLTPTVICPLDIEIDCEKDFNNFDVVGKPLVYTSCDELDCNTYNDSYTRKKSNIAPFLGEEIPAYNNSCRNGAIKRTWNCAGSTCSQWIIVRPDEDHELEITWPRDTIINCLAEEAGVPEFNESPCELIGVSVEVDTFIFEEGACYKFLKHWTLISWCDYDASDSDINMIPEDSDDGIIPGIHNYTQVVKLFDEDKPIVLAEHQVVGTNAECVTEGAFITAKATDEGACASDWIKWDVEIDLGGDLDYDYTYSSGLPPDDPYYIGPTSGNNIDSTFQGNEVVVYLPDGLEARCGSRHRVRYSAYDGCGNVTRVTKNLEIRDSKAPTPYMVDASSALMASGGVELWASDFNIGSFDNCSDGSKLWYTFSSNVPPQIIDPLEEDPWYDADGIASQNDFGNGQAEKWNESIASSSMIFNCDALDEALSNGGFLELKVYAWDECFNTDFAIVNLNIIDNMEACGPSNRAAISGSVTTENGEGIMDLMVHVTSEQVNYPIQEMTIQDGSYAFENNPMSNDYIITGEKNDDWLNGVTTLDLVLIQRHILDLLPLDSPYKMIAADASNDQEISGVDLIIIRKLILGIYDEYPNNASWRLVNAQQTLDIDNPWPFDEKIILENLEESMGQQNFYGVKIGDVNGSVSSNLTNNATSERSQKSMNFSFENQIVEKGQEISVDIFAEDFKNIYGFQLAIEFDGLQFNSISSNELNIDSENYSYRNDQLIISWNNMYGMSLDRDVLFTINLTVNEHGSLNNMFSLSNHHLYPEVYQGEELEVMELNLTNESISVVNSLSQNEPNPWNGETLIEFNLVNTGQVNLTVFDQSGKVVFTETDYFEKGQNRYLIKEDQLQGSYGVLYYKIESGNYIATKKMIMLHD